MLGAFLRGTTTCGVGEVLKQLDVVAGQFKSHQENMYTLTTSYHLLKSGQAALTSYAAQKVSGHLSDEQRAVVDPESGLHVFGPHRKTDSVNFRLNWDTCGATTFADVQTLLTKRQPLTFSYLRQLATPERHNPEKGYRYGPPEFVCESLLSQVRFPTHHRLQRKCSLS